MVRTRRGISSILSLAHLLTFAASVIIVLIALTIVVASVDNPFHVLGVPHFVVHAEARPTACTATLTLVVSRKSISTRKSAATLEAGVRTLASV